MFRDTCSVPEGPPVVLHEYQILGTADRATGMLRSVEAVPRVLPYPECPLAAANASRMNGTELRAHAK